MLSLCIHSENQNQVSFYPFILHETSVDEDFYHLDLADCSQTWHVYLAR